MLNFDVILGMDWLSKNYATIDCYKKCIVFKLLGEDEFVFQGDRSEIPTNLISVVRVGKLLRKGCQGFLAHIMDTRVESGDLQRIPVVNEFPDVFPEELLGLPPDKEIEFSIELLPGTSPISIAPYCMALTELRELKSQLQDLLDKGFIKPSSSP